MARYVSIALGIIASGLFFLSACSQPDLQGQQSQAGNTPGAREPSTEAPAGTLEEAIASVKAAPSNSTITIGSLNLMNFGQSKLKKEDSMNILARTLRDYDIAAVQEIEDSAGTAIIALRDRMNALPPQAHYEVLVGERVGDAGKEQYAFIYNTDKVGFTGKSYNYPDPNDRFVRPPFCATFKVVDGTFDFTLVDIHTQPNNATKEILALEEVVKDAQVKLGEPDVITLGDFNAGGDYMPYSVKTGFRDSTIYRWIIADGTDTTATEGNSNTYDRIVITRKYTDEDYLGSGTMTATEGAAWGVSDWVRAFGVSQDDIKKNTDKKASDHKGVWARFSKDKDSD